ncbi:MAG: DUF2156 domain-containing protein [Clostridiaceae bacterium]|nr:DUF2156 domain-containing protein [Clostridiaceae bacterium]
MTNFKPLTIEERDLFTDIFKNYQPVTSELSFSYLYMWRGDYNLSWDIIEDYLCLVSKSEYYSPFAFCPIPVDGKKNDLNFRKALNALEEHFAKENLTLIFGRVPEGLLADLQSVYQERIEVEFLDWASDYVYEVSNLISLPGKKLRKKRNHINKFLREYGSYEYVPIDETNKNECRRIFEEWCDKNDNCNERRVSCERMACYELINNWSKLPLKGAFIKVNGNFEAFTIGEKLNDYTAVVHVEKGNSDIHGIYPLINRDFCINEWRDLKYINREEDMGIEGLRKSKLSYNPDLMVKKFLVKVLH